MSGVVILGAGQAAAAMAAKLRALGDDRPITVIGRETLPPYQRPPLSKAYLLGEMGPERLTLRADSFWAEAKISLRLGAPVTAIDPGARRLRLGGETLTYDQLALTLGARPRRLDAARGGDLAGVHCLRERADIDALRPEMRPGARLAIVGGGYIGLEAAAVARKLGLAVTLIEAAPRILARVASAETAAWFAALHRSRGVTLLEDTALDRLIGESRVEALRLADGREIGCDLVILGIGVAPETELAAAAGLAIDNGIATDAYGRCSDPAIWSAGDCASFPWQGGRLRLESVGNAIDMGECVAANMLGANLPYQPKPWFWSDQYEVKLQIAGLNSGYDQVVSRLGANIGANTGGNTGGASFWYFRAGQLIAVDAANDARAYMIGKRLIEAGRSPDPAQLADPAQDLKALLA